ncbi:MAG: tRNA lysidine(34) synthetase TilS [Pirellulales bacterium]
MASNKQFALEELVDKAWPSAHWRDTHVVLGVSGGADSVALLRAVLALNGRCGGRGAVRVAHLNHGLRGPAADADQAWLEQLCGQLGVPISVGHANVSGLASEQGDGWEAAARTARYSFLQTVAEEVGARFVAVAHTADDQAETVLHRIVRGTGLAGLAGMPVSRPLSASVSLVRPLLAARRGEVLEYLAAVGQEYRTDDLNADARFTRNRLRHELLPLLREKLNPEVDSALLRLASQAGEAQRWLVVEAEAFVGRCVVIEMQRGRQVADPPRRGEGESGRHAGEASATVSPSPPLPFSPYSATANSIRIKCSPLADQPPLLVREVCKAAWERANWPLQAAGFEVWDQLAKLVQADKQAAALNLPGDIRAVRVAGEVVLTRAGCFP